jgi:predicted ATPase
LPYWQRAGQRASERSAYVEAIAYLTKGLELLETLPDTPERRQQELTLRVTLGAPLMMTKGYAAPEVERACAQALELCRQLGETPRLFPVLGGLRGFYLARAELQTARELGERLLRLAQRVQHPALLLQAHYALGETLFYLGELVAARAHLEQGSRSYEPQKHRSYSLRAVQHPGVACRANVASVLWLLGYPDQALQRGREALILAQELAHPISVAFASYFAAVIHQYRREWQLAQAQAEAAITRSREQGFPFWVAMGAIVRGWTLVAQGQEQEGIAQMRQSLVDLQATGAALSRPHWLALLAEAYRRGGQAEEGLRLLAEALTVAHSTGGRYYEAELYRLQGELLLMCSAAELTEAETCFHQALDVARRQQAKAFELRAAMSLARLWQRQGKRAEAHALLAPIYGWFTEGFDTADLQEARTLLEALS